MTKSGPDTAVAGTTVTYTLLVHNNGPSNALNVAVSDSLPGPVTNGRYCKVTGAVDCSLESQYSALPGSGAIDTIASLAPGAANDVTYKVKADIPASTAKNTSLSDTATASSTTADDTPGNNSSTKTTTVDTKADVSMTKSGPDTAVAGTTVTYTLLVHNNGPSNALNVAVSDSLPGPVTNGRYCKVTGAVDCSLESQYSALPGSGAIDTIASLAPGAANDVTYKVKADIPASTAKNTSLSDTATASSTTADDTPGNNSSTKTTTVDTKADVSMTKSGPDTAVAGTTVTYTLLVHN